MTEYHKLDNDKQIFFYEQEFYVLSNFSAFQIEWRDKRFQTSEHAYQSEKFPEGSYAYDLIRGSWSAHDAFKIAEKYKADVYPNWSDIRVNIMREILWAKLRQHEYVKRKLLATGDRELIEDSWRDDFWGWGPDKNGYNMLGELWMEIRDELRS